ncbi:hypothetical protein KU6B_18030 [Mameliella alba]|uniref:hypothetical protein n=1 Tax=Mameliella alba TaxID=561184 RepID=UPI0013E4924D|nr:hypothetical protein [Mameliella alba]BBU55538.1 hypothetical protein KU6B_18030 [Mameliella alba]
METLRGSVLTESGWIAGELGFAHRVDRIEGQPTETPAPPLSCPALSTCMCMAVAART